MRAYLAIALTVFMLAPATAAQGAVLFDTAGHPRLSMGDAKRAARFYTSQYLMAGFTERPATTRISCHRATRTTARCTVIARGDRLAARFVAHVASRQHDGWNLHAAHLRLLSPLGHKP